MGHLISKGGVRAFGTAARGGGSVSGSIDNGELINFLYQAVDEPAAMDEFARHFATSYDTPFGILTVRSKADFQVLDVTEWGFGKAGLEAYMGYYYQHDVLTIGLMQLPHSKFYPHQKSYDDDDFLKTELYNDFAVPMELRYAVGAIFPIPHSAHCFHFGVCRRPNQDPYGPQLVAKLDQLVPHLQQFLYLRSRFGELTARASLMEQTLSRLKLAVFICDEHLNILHQTDQAEDIVQSRSEVTARNKVLGFQNSKKNSELSRLVRNAVGASRGEDQPPGGVLRIDDGGGLLEVVITPIRYAPPGEVFNSSAPSAAVFMRNAATPRVIAPDALSILYDLSPSEADIAVRMNQGLSLMQIANIRRVSVQTVRSQIKTLYQKTGTSRQADLVALVGTSLAGLAPPLPS